MGSQPRKRTHLRRIAWRFARRVRAAERVVVGPLPYLAATRYRSAICPRAILACVYREPNANRVHALASEAERAGMDVRLWALDRVSPELVQFTVGSGPGSRFGLLNTLSAGADDSQWLVIADDDVRFVTPAPLRTLLAIAVTGRLDICQPTHARGSWRSHDITRQQLLVSLRETTFVEIGPVVVFSPRAQSLVLPFPESGMGWGVELDWAAHRSDGLRLGMLDCVPLLHLSPMGGYDVAAEFQGLQERLARHGLSNIGEAQRTVRMQRLV